MRKNIRLLFVGLIVGGLGSTQVLSCERPREPEFKDEIVERVELAIAIGSVNNYIRDINRYAACLRRESTDALENARIVREKLESSMKRFRR